jgi:hypothetical protein
MIEEIPTVNRACLIVTPRKPFLDWINSFAERDLDRISMNALREDGSVYLVPEVEHEEEVNGLIETVFEHVFKLELDAWQTDRSRWPKITWELFYEWFDVDCRSVVMDLCDTPLKHDD